MKRTINEWVLVKPIDEQKKNPLAHLGIDFEIVSMVQDEWRYKTSKGEVECDSSCGLLKGDIVHYDYIANDLFGIDGCELIGLKNIRSLERDGILKMIGKNIYVVKIVEEKKQGSGIILLNDIEKSTCWVTIMYSEDKTCMVGEKCLVESGFLVPENINGLLLYRTTIDDILGSEA